MTAAGAVTASATADVAMVVELAAVTATAEARAVPTSGVSGSLSTAGVLHADWSAPAPTTYCTAKLTSGGCTLSIGSSGTATIPGRMRSSGERVYFAMRKLESTSSHTK